MSANFEQDRHYEDMDGNLKTFTIRDYSKPKGIAMAPSTEETKRQANQAYIDSTYEIVDDMIDSVPAIFGREVKAATFVKDEKIVWDRDALFLMVRSNDDFPHNSSDWNLLKNKIFSNIVEHINCKDLDCRDKVKAWKEKYRKTKTL